MEFGLIGEHLSHSESKPIHAMLGDYAYELISLPPDALPGFLRRREFKGLNVTIPYKKAVLPFCARASAAAARIGAANTLLADKGGGLYADNTDYAGFIDMARRAGADFKGKKALVLGSGGASATVRAALEDGGAREMIVVSRGGPVTYGMLDQHRDADLIINTTPVGMYPDNGRSPVDLTLFPNCRAVLDLIYNPANTALLLDAKRLGIPCANGLHMLVSQAWHAARLFTGADIPKERIEKIRQSLEAARTNIVLVGMPGSGKTRIGREVARILSRPFVDTDALIENRTGRKIGEIFGQSGEAEFRGLEREAVARAGKERGQVIATGGGAVLFEENMRNLKQNGNVYFIERALCDLSTEGRPLSTDIAALEKMVQIRLPLYVRYADRRVQNVDAERAAREIAEEYL